VIQNCMNPSKKKNVCTPFRHDICLHDICTVLLMKLNKTGIKSIHHFISLWLSLGKAANREY
jgi:hypothetical protein